MYNKTFEIQQRTSLAKKKQILEIPDEIDTLVRRQVESFRHFSPYFIQENFTFGPSEVLLRFHGNKIAAINNSEALNKNNLVDLRCKGLAAIIENLWGRYAEIMCDMDLMIPFSFSDMSSAPRQQIPSLTFCKEQNSNNILVPSINNLVGYAEIEHVAMCDFPLLHKENIICFVGSLTNIYWNEKGIKYNQRLQVASLATRMQELFCRIIPPKYFDDEKFKQIYGEVIENFPSLANTEELSDEKNRVDIKEQLKYKYQLCIDGHVSAWARLPWQLYANCVPIKIRNPDFQFLEWYYPLLDFSKDCLEINLDQLAEVYEWLNNDPEEQLNISNRGKAFVERYINVDLGQRIFLWTLLLLSEKQQLYLDKLV